jgi:hypothetical protein
VKETCESINRNKTCETSGTAGTKTCKWIAEEEEDHKCAELKETCDFVYFHHTPLNISGYFSRAIFIIII